MSDMQARLARLLDERDITQLLNRRVSGLDLRDIPAQLACFTPDGTYDHGSFRGRFADFIAQASQTARPDSPIQVVSHLISNVMITFEDDDHANTTCKFLVVSRRGKASGNHDSMTVGKYIDTVTRHDGTWLISSRRVEFEWSQIFPLTAIDAWILHDPNHPAA